MLHIKHFELSTDKPMLTPQARELASAVGRAIEQAWHGAGSRPNLCIDRLVVQASTADLERRSFVRELAQSTVARIHRRAGE